MKVTTFGGLGTIFDGPHATPTRREEGPYFLNISSLNAGRLDLAASDHVSEGDFARWTRRVTPEAGDLLFSYETRLGEAALMPSGLRACLGRRMALLRPGRDVIEPRFLLYYYLSPSFQETIRHRSIHGATVERILLSTMTEWPVQLPPLPTQRAIAEVLGALDDKIAANARANEASAHLAEALYLRACAAGATEVALWEAIEVTFGEPFSGTGFSVPGIGRPLIRIRDLKTHSCQVWTTDSRPAESIIAAGDVVAGMDAEFRPSYWLGEDGLLNQRCLTARARSGGRAFALEALKAPLARIEASKSATTVIHLNKSDLLRESVVMPPLHELSQFTAIAEPLRLRRVALAGESRHLATLRDTLLPHLMSGRLTVRDAEKQVGEAL